MKPSIASIPPAFTCFNDQTGPFFEAVAPLYWRADASSGGLVFGLPLQERHTNAMGVAHGGMLLTLVDVALGINLERRREFPQPVVSFVTVSMTSEFLSPARVDDWLEAHVTIRRMGRLAFGDCLLLVDDRCVVRASGVFSQPRSSRVE